MQSQNQTHPQQNLQQQTSQSQNQTQQQQQSSPPLKQEQNQPSNTTSPAPKTRQPNHLNPKQLAFLNDSWVCVLCRKIGHYRSLGDLFGPYLIDFSDTADRCKAVTPKKSKYSLLNHNYAVKEVWLHEDCLVWSEGVHLVGKKILKMDEVIKASFNHNCSLCKTKGATLGCIGKRCRRKFHYVCARDSKKCLLDESNFSLKCDKCLAPPPDQNCS